jgi:hypothetical protein
VGRHAGVGDRGKGMAAATERATGCKAVALPRPVTAPTLADVYWPRCGGASRARPSNTRDSQSPAHRRFAVPRSSRTERLYDMKRHKRQTLTETWMGQQRRHTSADKDMQMGRPMCTGRPHIRHRGPRAAERPGLTRPSVGALPRASETYAPPRHDAGRTPR